VQIHVPNGCYLQVSVPDLHLSFTDLQLLFTDLQWSFTDLQLSLTDLQLFFTMAICNCPLQLSFPMCMLVRAAEGGRGRRRVCCI